MSGKHHVDMLDAVLEVVIVFGDEPQGGVEGSEVTLGADADCVLRPGTAVEGDAPRHQFPSEARATLRGSDHDATDGALVESGAGREAALVGEKPAILDVPAVQRRRVHAIGIEVGAFLFDDKYLRAQLQNRVDFCRRELAEAMPVPASRCVQFPSPHAGDNGFTMLTSAHGRKQYPVFSPPGELAMILLEMAVRA